jgi:beta-lactamase class C
MKKSIGMICILCLSIFNTAQASVALSADKVSGIMTRLMQKDHISGAAIALIDHGKKSIYVFGKTRSAHPMPVTDKTLFELGSATKVMTTLVLSEEIQNQQAKLTDGITAYFPELSKNSAMTNINLEQLATHTSRLPFNEPKGIKTKAQLTRYLLHWKPRMSAETKWQYSNMGVGLLGNALAKQNHQSINQLFEDNIFIPLNMTTSSMAVRSDTQHLLDLFPATWALKSNIIDMSYFLAAAIGLPNTPKNILQAMQFAQTPRIQAGEMKQALAWQVYSLRDKQKLRDVSQYMDLLKTFPAQKLPENQQYYDSDTLMDKTGATGGFRAYIAVIPSQKSGIVVLMNKHVSEGDIVGTGRKILLDNL